MPIYAYRCRECGSTRDSTSNSDVRPCVCGGLSKRDYHTVQLRPGSAFKEHFNWSVGRHVSTERDFHDALKRCEEDNSVQAGCEHHYEAIGPGDLAPSKDTEVFETRERNLTSLGLREAKPKNSTVAF